MVVPFKEIYENYQPSERANVGKPELPKGGVIAQEIGSLGQEGSFSQVINPPYTLPEAKFNALGGVRLTRSVGQNLSPRVLVPNSSIKYCNISPSDHTVPACEVSSNIIEVVSSSTTSAGADASDSDGFAYSLGTGVSAGADALIWSIGLPTIYYCQPRHYPYIYTKFKLSHTSGYRLWLYFSDADAIGSDTPAINMIGMRFSSGAGDTKLQLASGDGTTSTVDLSDTVAADTLYEVEIWADGSAIYGQVNGGTIIKKTTNIPSSSTGLRQYSRMVLRSVTAGTDYRLTHYGSHFSQN